MTPAQVFGLWSVKSTVLADGRKSGSGHCFLALVVQADLSLKAHDLVCRSGQGKINSVFSFDGKIMTISIRFSSFENINAKLQFV